MKKKKDPKVKVKHKDMVRAKRTQAKLEERYNPSFSKTIPEMLADRATGAKTKVYEIPAPIDLSKNKNAKLKLIRALRKKEAEQKGETFDLSSAMLSNRGDMKAVYTNKLNDMRRKRKVAELNEDGTEKDDEVPLSKRRKREEVKADGDLATSSEVPSTQLTFAGNSPFFFFNRIQQSASNQSESQR